MFGDFLGVIVCVGGDEFFQLCQQMGDVDDFVLFYVFEQQGVGVDLQVVVGVVQYCIDVLGIGDLYLGQVRCVLGQGVIECDVQGFLVVVVVMIDQFGIDYVL